MREKNPISHEQKLAYLRDLRESAIHSASEEAVEKQHAKGKMTARERIEKLLDPGSFEELDTFVRHRTYDFEMQKKRPWGDAVVTGHGTIDGRTVFVFSQDSAARETANSLASALGAGVGEYGSGPVDLLVVGSRPEAPAGKVVLSAKSDYAVEAATYPVLVLPRGSSLAFSGASTAPAV